MTTHLTVDSASHTLRVVIEPLEGYIYRRFDVIDRRLAPVAGATSQLAWWL